MVLWLNRISIEGNCVFGNGLLRYVGEEELGFCKAVRLFYGRVKVRMVGDVKNEVVFGSY